MFSASLHATIRKVFVFVMFTYSRPRRASAWIAHSSTLLFHSLSSLLLFWYPSHRITITINVISVSKMVWTTASTLTQLNSDTQNPSTYSISTTPSHSHMHTLHTLPIHTTAFLSDVLPDSQLAWPAWSASDPPSRRAPYCFPLLLCSLCRSAQYLYLILFSILHSLNLDLPLYPSLLSSSRVSPRRCCLAQRSHMTDNYEYWFTECIRTSYSTEYV